MRIVFGRAPWLLFVCTTIGLTSVRKRNDVNCVVDFLIPPESKSDEAFQWVLPVEIASISSPWTTAIYLCAPFLVGWICFGDARDAINQNFRESNVIVRVGVSVPCHCRFHIVTCCLVFKEHHRSVDLINRVIIFVLLFIHLDRERDSQSKICNYNFYLFAISFCLFVGLCERDKTLIYDMKVLGRIINEDISKCHQINLMANGFGKEESWMGCDWTLLE